MLTVSAIVPTFNRAGYLDECLASLLGQTIAPLQVVVVDDGSEDATRNVVARYGGKVQYIYKHNGGKSSAVNAGMTQCIGDLVWLFDDDDVALPTAIESRLRILENAPDAGFVYSPHHTGMGGEEGTIQPVRLQVPRAPSHEAFFFEVMRGCFFHLNSALVRRGLYATVGPFDESLRAGEDYDMQIRLARFGRAAFSPTPSFIFRQHAGLRGDTSERYKVTERSRVFRRYSTVIGEKVRRSVPLSQFLVPPVAAAEEPSQVRRGLLNRMQVMANLGCVREFFDDLAALLQVPGSPGLTSDEAEKVGLAMRTGWAYEAAADDWGSFLAQVRDLRGVPGGGLAARAIAASLWRQARSYPGTLRERSKKAVRAAQVGLPLGAGGLFGA